MRVLFLTTAYPTPEQPVSGTFVREHARAAQTVADVSVVHLDRSSGRKGLFELARIEDDVGGLRVRYRRFPRPVSYGAFVAGAAVAARRAGKVDVVHAHSFVSALPGLVLARALRVPLVYTEHWSVFLPDDPASLTAPMRRLARLALESADVVAPVSDAMRRALAELAPRASFRVVRNAVDEAVFFPPTVPAPRGRRLLTVGLMDDASKGIDVLLGALALVPDARLDVVGDGTLRAGLKRIAADVGVADRVVFHGLRTKPEIAELMRAADAFVLASRFENNPVVALEALSSGLPVAATTVGGLPEVIGRAEGVLVNDREHVANEVAGPAA